MKFWKEFEKRTRSVGNWKLRLSIFGSFLVTLMLGAMFSLKLITVSYILLIIGIVFIGKYQYDNCMGWYGKTKLPYWKHWFGFFGTTLVMLVLGIQSPHFPLQLILLISGVVLIIPAAIDFVK